MAMRDKHKNIISAKLETLDVNDFGSYPDITPSIAVSRAKELRALITQGIDPQAEKKEKQKEHTFKTFFIERYMPMQIARRNMNTTILSLPNGRIRFKDVVESKNGKLLEGYNAHIKTAKFINKKLSSYWKYN